MLRHYTQNIDCVEQHLPGLLARTVQLHGRIDQAKCQLCGSIAPFAIDAFRGVDRPACDRCQGRSLERKANGKRELSIGRLRTGIVLYGEEHPNDDPIKQFWEKDLQTGPDMVIVVGTRLSVPGARTLARQLCRKAQANGGTTVWINRESPRSDVKCNFDRILLGKCDDVAHLVSK